MMICAIVHRHYFRSSHISLLVHLYTLSIKSLTHFSRKLEVKLYYASQCFFFCCRNVMITIFIRPRLHNTASCQSGLTTMLTNSHCSFNRLSKRVVQPVWQLAVYMIQPVVKTVAKPVWQQVVSCKRGFNDHREIYLVNMSQLGKLYILVMVAGVVGFLTGDGKLVMVAGSCSS